MNFLLQVISEPKWVRDYEESGIFLLLIPSSITDHQTPWIQTPWIHDEIEFATPTANTKKILAGDEFHYSDIHFLGVGEMVEGYPDHTPIEIEYCWGYEYWEEYYIYGD